MMLMLLIMMVIVLGMMIIPMMMMMMMTVSVMTNIHVCDGCCCNDGNRTTMYEHIAKIEKERHINKGSFPEGSALNV